MTQWPSSTAISRFGAVYKATVTTSLPSDSRINVYATLTVAGVKTLMAPCFLLMDDTVIFLNPELTLAVISITNANFSKKNKIMEDALFTEGNRHRALRNALEKFIFLRKALRMDIHFQPSKRDQH